MPSNHAFSVFQFFNKAISLSDQFNGLEIHVPLLFPLLQFSSVQFSHSVVSNSLQPHESQHARPPCPSPSPGVHRDSRASSQWCHPAISSSVVPFSSCPQSLPASESFPMNQLFARGGQSTGVSALAFLYLISWIDLTQSGLQWLPWSSSFIISMTSFLLNILSWMAHANLKHISKYTYLLGLLLPFKLQICFSFCALISVNSTTNYKCCCTWNLIIILIPIFFLHLMNHQGLSILWPVSKDYPLLSNLSTIIVVRALIQFLLDYCSSFLIIENTTYAQFFQDVLIMKQVLL